MNALAHCVLILQVATVLHYTLSFTQQWRGRTSLSHFVSRKFASCLLYSLAVIGESHCDAHTQPFNGSAAVERANATFVVLCRNSDLNGILISMREVEDRFNSKYGYPWVFLNEVPFTDEFKKRVSILTSASVEFGLIPRDHWYQPRWIDEDKAAHLRNKMVQDDIPYGGSISYRNMCRFNSGFFFKHDLVKKYRYYWRVEPDVHFHCNVLFDPFLFMQKENKTYGFTITMYEYEVSIPTLWESVREFTKMHPEYLAEENAIEFISDTNGHTYNLCHFWTNFEIADMDFWRGEAYTAFFDFLDAKGGFYYERWGDAPVHSIAAALFLSKHQLHFFEEIGYEHNPFTHCPRGEQWARGRCSCDPQRSFDYDGYSCMRKWDQIMGRYIADDVTPVSNMLDSQWHLDKSDLWDTFCRTKDA